MGNVLKACLGHIGELAPEQLYEITGIINQQLLSQLTVPILAEALGMGPDEFSEAFRASTRLAPEEFVRRRRVERALVLLKKWDVDLADMHTTLGFSTQAQFIAEFRKVLGISPAYYRARVLAAKSGSSALRITKPPK